MNLQNGYKVLYEVAADGKRTFYATKNIVCDPKSDDEIAKVTIGEYKLIYEKDGQIYGSTTGIPTAEDQCITGFNKAFKVTEANTETPAATTYTKRTRKAASTVEKTAEEKAATETPATVEIG